MPKSWNGLRNTGALYKGSRPLWEFTFMGATKLEALRQLKIALAEGLVTPAEHTEEKRKILIGSFSSRRYVERIDKDISNKFFRSRGPRLTLSSPPTTARCPNEPREMPLWHPHRKEWKYCSGKVQTTVYGFRGEFATRQSWDSTDGSNWYRV